MISAANHSPLREEWKQGWRVVLGAAIGSGLGIPLYYYTFSLFTLGMMESFRVTRGEMANFQALIVAGALTAPLIGRWLDAHGFARVFTVCTLIVCAAHLAMATVIDEVWQFAFIAFVYGAGGSAAGRSPIRARSTPGSSTAAGWRWGSARWASR